MRDRGLSPAGCNIYIGAMNAFCSWLHENGHLGERVRIKQIKVAPTRAPSVASSVAVAIFKRPLRVRSDLLQKMQEI